MKTIYLKKTSTAIRMLVAGLFLFTALSNKAQCVSNFTYAIGANGVVNFGSTSTGTTPGTGFIWMIGGVGGGYAYGQNVTHTYTTNGMRSVCLTIMDTTANCNSTFCDSVIVNNVVSPSCSPTVVYSLSKDSAYALTWNAFPSYPANITNATWSWGDGSTTTGLYPSHTYSAAGTYSTCVTVSVSCGTITATYCYVASIFRSSQSGQSSSMIVLNVRQMTPTGVKSINKENDLFNIYPNPSNGLFTLELNESTKQSNETRVYIYNMLGEKVFEKNILSNGKQNVDVSELNNGAYFVKIVSDNGSYSKRISIQK